MASKYYDPQKAHEYYMAHRKLKGRKKKSSSSKKTKAQKTSTKAKSYNTQLNDLMATMNADDQRMAEIEKQKIDNERKEYDEALKKKWNDKIKEIKEKIKKATDEEKEELKTELATLQVDYKLEKTAFKNYFDAKTLNHVATVANKGGDNNAS